MPPEIVDLNGYQVTDWPTTSEGEERHARETVQHYQALFAHPLVEGITWWDLLDGGWLNVLGRVDPKRRHSKTCLQELMKLIKGEWWLTPTQLFTDEKGKIHLIAFWVNTN